MLVVDDIYKGFSGRSGTAKGGRSGYTTVLEGISFDVKPGEVVSLLGASGCGKTTLLRIIGGLIRSDAGEEFLPDRSQHGGPALPHQLGKFSRLGVGR